MKRSTKAALLLAILSPSIAELLSSSSPPVEFLNPISFLYLTTFYGFAAILIREFRVRRGLGYSSILFLGMAYGIVEEGLGVKSFFSTDWPDLGVLAWYGRALGVNWVWSLALTIYHSVISIFIPIVIAEILFRDIRNEPWIMSGNILKAMILIFVFDVILFNIGFVGHVQPSAIHYILTLLVILGLYWLSTWCRIRPFYIHWGPIVSWFSGVIWMLFFYFIFFGLANLDIPTWITILLGVIHAYIGMRFLMRIELPDTPENVKMAIALGPPSLFIFLAPFLEMDPSRPDNPAGMTIVGIFFALVFILFYRWSKKPLEEADSGISITVE